MDELNEMGWNDALGNIRSAWRVSFADKLQWLEKILTGNIQTVRSEKNYIDGVRDLVQTLRESPTEETLLSLEFKGPPSVISKMLETVRSSDRKMRLKLDKEVK